MILAALSVLVGACTIGGTVSADGPVERARVIVTTGNESFLRLTDAQGSFCFDLLNSGNYLLTVQKAGYLEYSHPVILAVETDSPIELPAISLTRYASLAGTVVDSDGEILPGAGVKLWQRARGNPDEIESSEADERGEFHFSRLAPGTYYLSAQADENNRYMFSLADSHGRVANQKRLATFYSGSFSFAGATPLELKAGQGLEHLVLALERAQLHRLSGRITIPNHEPFLSFSGETEGGSESSGAIPIASDGAFAKVGLPPAKYTLYLNDGGKTVARQEVDLTRGDALNVALEPIQEFSVPVTFHTEGKGPAFRPISQTTLLMRESSDDAWPLAASPDGSYRFSMVPSGAYRLRVALGAQKFYVKRIAYEGRTVSTEKIELHGEPPGPLEITLSPEVAEIQGKITGPNAGNAGITIVLVDGGRIVNEAGTDQRGRFEMTTVAPGNYRILAIEDFDADNWSADVAKALQAQSTNLQLQENDRKQVKIPVVSAKEFDSALRQDFR